MLMEQRPSSSSQEEETTMLSLGRSTLLMPTIPIPNGEFLREYTPDTTTSSKISTSLSTPGTHLLPLGTRPSDFGTSSREPVLNLSLITPRMHSPAPSQLTTDKSPQVPETKTLRSGTLLENANSPSKMRTTPIGYPQSDSPLIPRTTSSLLDLGTEPSRYGIHSQ